MFGRFRAPAHQKFPDACLSCRWHGRLGQGLFPHDNAELIWKYAGKCRRRVGKADADKRRAILEGMAEVWSRLATKPSKKDEEDLRSAGSAIDSARWPIVGKFTPGGGYIRGQPRPYLRHLQHGRLGLRIRRGACDFQALRRKPAILAYPPHAENPHRRLRYRNATTAITFPHAKRIPQRSEAVESSAVGAGSAARAVWSALKGLQNRLAQTDRIALTALRKFNDLLGDRICLRLVAIL
jgi:hypothetical protein